MQDRQEGPVPAMISSLDHFAGELFKRHEQPTVATVLAGRLRTPN